MSAEIRLLERLSFDAWPAKETIDWDGWILRFADGYTRRANSVNPLETEGDRVGTRIDRCERLFGERGLRCTFKMTPASQPPDLEKRLDRRGYRSVASTRVQIHDLESRGPAAPELDMTRFPTPRWLEAFAAWNLLPEARRPHHASILRAIRPRCAFAELTAAGELVACGLGVLHGGWLGLYDLVTAPAKRRRGYGRELVEGLLAWGAEEGARHAYLQVMDDNEAARRLYAEVGFRDAYPYWYRVSGASG